MKLGATTAQRALYEKQCDRAGLHGNHGLRHQYAQSRYRELTGWPPPHADGPAPSDLGPAQRRIDYRVCREIAEELGHGCIDIVAVYCGL